MKLLNIKYIYINIIFILSPFYIVSMTQDKTPFTGYLINILDIEQFTWYLLLIFGLVLVLFDILNSHLKIKFDILIISILLFLSIWITFSKNLLGLDILHLGIIWSFVMLLTNNLEKEKLLKIIYFYACFFIILNFIISLSQILNNFKIYEHIELLRSYTGIARATGVYNTPLATGISAIFFAFFILSFPKEKFKFRKVFFSFSFFILLFSMSKTSLLIFSLFLIFIVLNFLSRKLNIKLSHGIKAIAFLLLLLFFLFLGFELGYYLNTFSIYYKPYSILSFIEVIIYNPIILLIGFTHDFVSEYTIILNQYGNWNGVNSSESWLLGLIAYYGVFYIVLLFISIYKALHNPFYLNKSYLLAALVAPIVASFASNGGIQFPTGFYYFILLGILIFSKERNSIEFKA